MVAISLHWGLNPGPSVYKTDALPLSYRGRCSNVSFDNILKASSRSKACVFVKLASLTSRQNKFARRDFLWEMLGNKLHHYFKSSITQKVSLPEWLRGWT